jgi:hypothetical protein
MLIKSVIACFTILLLCAVPLRAQASQPGRTVLDGVFSEGQAQRGQAAYTAHCSGCHGDALEGVSAPQLTGNHFLERWREDTLDVFFNFIRENMPFGQPPGAPRIPDGDYLDILTHILNINGYRTGPNDLTAGLLDSVMLVGKNGPQPVPDGALVISVGCLSQARDGIWVLFNATEPARTRQSTTSTAAERNASTQKQLGTLIFRLADLDAVPDFSPDAHK